MVLSYGARNGANFKFTHVNIYHDPCVVRKNIMQLTKSAERKLRNSYPIV
jgi:hypothetical protein